MTVDGVPAGSSPLTVPDLAAGNHTVVVSLSGYRDAEDEVAIPQGDGFPFVIPLNP